LSSYCVCMIKLSTWPLRLLWSHFLHLGVLKIGIFGSPETYSSLGPKLLWANFWHFGGLKTPLLPISEIHSSSWFILLWAYFCILAPWKSYFYPVVKPPVLGDLRSLLIFRILTSRKCELCPVVNITVQGYTGCCVLIFAFWRLYFAILPNRETHSSMDLGSFEVIFWLLAASAKLWNSISDISDFYWMVPDIPYGRLLYYLYSCRVTAVMNAKVMETCW
jgi:hypothetical protein